MLLVIDVGNTNITLGVFNKDELFGTFRMKTKQPRTSDEYGITLQELVERHGIESSKINAVILASVVPDVMHSLAAVMTLLYCCIISERKRKKRQSVRLKKQSLSEMIIYSERGNDL